MLIYDVCILTKDKYFLKSEIKVSELWTYIKEVEENGSKIIYLKYKELSSCFANLKILKK